MSVGKACGKQTVQYPDKQSDEESVVTSRDTTAAENEVYSSDDTHRQSMNLKEMSTVKQTGDKGETEKGVLQECWDSAKRWLTSSSATMISDQTGQRALQEC
jgi:hypothetical protein